MKILMLTPRFPYPPNRGDCIRSWGEVQYLARGHDVWLACIDRVAPAPEHLAHVRGHCRDVAVVVCPELIGLLRGGLSLIRGRSLLAGYFNDQRLARIVTRWGRAVDFDAVLTFSPAMAPYAALVSAGRRVLDMNDVESDKWRNYAQRTLPPMRWLYALESRRLRSAEAQWVSEHDVSLLVNASEVAKLPTALARHAAVVRTGVDLQNSRPADLESADAGVVSEPVIGFVGSMSYPPNVRAVNWFGRAVWPRVKEAVPEARWLIVGRDPSRSVRRWGRDAHVTVTGLVDDVRPWLHSMRVFVCPMREQIGVQTKLIEAMAAARAAVVTPQAAMGIDHDDPPPFMVAGSPSEFARAVIRVLRDRSHAKALAARALAVAAASYDARDQLRRIENWLAGDSPGRGRSLPSVSCGTIPQPGLITDPALDNTS